MPWQTGVSDIGTGYITLSSYPAEPVVEDKDQDLEDDEQDDDPFQRRGILVPQFGGDEGQNIVDRVQLVLDEGEALLQLQVAGHFLIIPLSPAMASVIRVRQRIFPVLCSGAVLMRASWSLRSLISRCQ